MILLKLEFLTVWILEDVAVKGKEKMLLKNIGHENWLSEWKKLVIISGIVYTRKKKFMGLAQSLY